MSDLRATEFEEILNGDFDTPCYVDTEKSFSYAIDVERPIVVLYGDEAVRGMGEFVSVSKNKKVFDIEGKIFNVMSKIGIAVSVFNLGVGAPFFLLEGSLKMATYGFFAKVLCDNYSKFKNYYMLVDEKNDRIVFLMKKIDKKKHTEIIDSIYSDFVSATTESIDKFDNIMKVTDVFTVTGRGTVLCGKVLKGNYKMGEEIRVVDSDSKEYAIDNIVSIELFRKIVDKASTGEECGLLINRNEELKKEIEKQKLLLKDIYVVK